MKIEILHEAGYKEALLGISLSYNQPIENMSKVANKLAHKDGGHNKFLESIAVWLDIIAPRYWWQQFDTYRIGVTKQSESTMHTILKGLLTELDFEIPISTVLLDRLNTLIKKKLFKQVKAELPESFLQRRVVCTNYKTLRHIYHQRKSHRLGEWYTFCREIFYNLNYPKFISKEDHLR